MLLATSQRATRTTGIGMMERWINTPETTLSLNLGRKEDGRLGGKGEASQWWARTRAF